MGSRGLARVCGAAVIAVAMVACGGSGAARSAAATAAPGATPADAIAVRVEAARRGAISSLYSTSATLRADKRATIIARTRGVVQRLLVEEGDTVAVDAPLAVLENGEQRIAAERARATADTRQREFERLERLREQELVSEEEFEQARREATDARHAFELAELELSRTVIRAPFAGAIMRRHLDVGATVADGTAVYDLADLDPLYADIQVPERHVAQLRPGQSVGLEADATHTTTTAVIERIAPEVDPSTGTVKVTLAVADSNTLAPGAFVRADIVTATHEDALLVPRSALVAEGRRWHLFRLGADRAKAEQIEVSLGFENGDRVEIASVPSGDRRLSAGDEVIVAGAPALSDGAAVRLVEAGEEAGESGAS